MEDAVIQSILARLQDLEQSAVRYRQGEVTDNSPFSVALGGSDTPLVGIKSLRTPHSVGDIVGALSFGPDALSLGPLSDGDVTGPAHSQPRRLAVGISTSVFSASANAATKVVTHGLVDASGTALTPSCILVSTTDQGFLPAGFSPSPTQFSVNMRTTLNTPFTGSVLFYWLVAA